MKYEQLSLLEPIKKPKPKKCIKYDATICGMCLCDKCKYNVDIYPCLSDKECKEVGNKSCFNCDDCYYYGMEKGSLKSNNVKFECNEFEMSEYYIESRNYHTELKAKKRRDSFKIIK